MKSIVRMIAAASLVVSADAQIGALSATADGKGVYFAVTKSEIRQRGSDQSFLNPKMYTLREGQLKLLDDTPGAGGLPKQYTRGSVSADGSVVAINYGVLCAARSCPGIPPATSIIRTPDRTFTFGGRSHITANGHFAVVYGQVTRLDLITGDSVTFGNPAANYGRFVAEDGTVLVRTSAGCQVIGASSSATFDCPPYIQHAVLSGDARLVVYDASAIVYDEAGLHIPYEIRVQDVQSGGVRSFGPGWDPTLAYDNRTFSYLRAPNGFTEIGSRFQVWVADVVTGSSRQLTNEPGGIVDQTITGDGKTVIAGSASGTLLSIDASTGAIHTLIELPATGGMLAGPAVPGSYNEIPGTLVEGSPEVLILPNNCLSGTADALAGVPLGPVPRGFAIQVPWEAGRYGRGCIVVRGSNPFWEWTFNAGVQSLWPVILPVDPSDQRLFPNTPYCCYPEPERTAYAMHENWSMPVLPENPARPGEVVHFFGTGFGPVEGDVPTGKPTPLDKYYPLRADACRWSTEAPYNPSEPVDVLFAGLAPGLIGLYQFDIRVPVDWTGSTFHSYCHTAFGYGQMMPPIAVKQ